MKFSSYFSTLSVLILISGLAGCKKSSISEPPPTIIAKPMKGYIATTTTVNTGDSVKIAWAALRGNKNMTTCTVTENGVNFIGFNGGKVKDLSGDQVAAFTDSIKFKAIATNNYVFRVSSENGAAAFGITVIVPDKIKSYNDLLLGEANGYLSTVDGNVYTDDQFEANKSKIDITFANLKDTLPTLLSSAQRAAEGLTKGINGSITYFKVSELPFATSTAKDINAVSTSGGSQKITVKKEEISVKDGVATVKIAGTYEFVNALGKKGLIKISDILKNGSKPYQMRISIKVQE